VTTKTIREIPFAHIERQFELASYWFGGKWCPAVDSNDRGGYQIRVLKGETRAGSNTTTTYDYFYLAEDGAVLTAPRGYARYFKPGRVTGLDEAVARYAEATR
jgi:hypothetical protein